MQNHSDAEWTAVLGHRPPAEIPDVADRFERFGVEPGTVQKVLHDLGDNLVDGFQSGWPDGYPDTYGGLDGLALLGAEVEVFAAYASRRAARVRADAFARLAVESGDSLDTIAKRLGIKKQTVHRALKRPGAVADFISDLTGGRVR